MDRKTFEWVHKDECHDFSGEGWECSQCGLELGPENSFVIEHLPYCPSCGSIHKDAEIEVVDGD